jgi:hypothetical protein
MPDAIDTLIADLRQAATEMNVDRSREITDRIVRAFTRDPAAVSDEQVLAAAKVLRRKRLLPHLERLVEAYLKNVRRTPLLRTLYAQALVDQDQLTAALAVLLQLLDEAPADPQAVEEARGLVGRVHKQAYVRAGDPLPSHGADALRLAVAAYADAYERARADKGDHFWPGINLVALLVRAQVERLPVRVAVDPSALARLLLKEADEALGAARDEPWLVATALEATLALDDDDETVRWGQRYLACEQADAFELGSTLRQLTEIWRLHQRAGRKAATLVPMLEAELLRNKPGAIVSGAVGARSVPLAGQEAEAIWGLERFRNYQWLQHAVRAGDAVGRVHDLSGTPVGSGFLVVGKDLAPRWGDELVFVTNRHVIDDPAPEKGIHFRRALVSLTTHEGADRDGIRIREILWKSEGADAGLDTVVLALQAPPADKQRTRGVELGGTADLVCGGDRPSRIYIIGHPSGESLSYSMYDNELSEVASPWLYYRSPTLHGSSGSPVFDDAWLAVAIHHSADLDRQANCGSMLDRIRAAIP